jgi:N-acetylmuramoyl-L-alanine amidase
MKKILIDNGHGVNTKGKRSPDESLLEYKYCREIASEVVKRLVEKGYDAELVTPEETDISLSTRVRRINTWCNKLGSSNCLSVSIHNNAAGNGASWNTASGWVVYVSQNASSNSKRLAKTLYDEAVSRGLKGNRSVPAEKYWVQSLAMCRDTKCPSVLTENLFMDNKKDCEYLLSNEGREKIIDLHVQGIIKYVNE